MEGMEDMLNSDEWRINWHREATRRQTSCVDISQVIFFRRSFGAKSISELKNLNNTILWHLNDNKARFHYHIKYKISSLICWLFHSGFDG